MLAAIRPNDWELPLFLHVLGAAVLVGGLVTAVGLQALAWRKRDSVDVAAFSRGGFWALLTVALPGWVLMRIGGQWIYSKEGFSEDDEPSWLGIGYVTADLGLVILLLSILLAGIGVRRLRKGRGAVFGRIALPLATILLVAYVIAMWAMTTKPD